MDQSLTSFPMGTYEGFLWPGMPGNGEGMKLVLGLCIMREDEGAPPGPPRCSVLTGA